MTRTAARGRVRRTSAALATVVLVVGGLWLLGFAVFDHVARTPTLPPPHADAIVALTGGADRVETALRLLRDNRAPLLLISGVGRGTDLAELLHHIALSPQQTAHVTLGHLATSTHGNAAETAAWARAHDVASLVVVTAGYHMPRALLELRRALPGIALYPVAVVPEALRRGAGFGTVRLLAGEFDKYLAVRCGLSRWVRMGGT